MRPPSPSIPEKEFLLSSLQQGLRLDGRLLLEGREPEIEFGEEMGWVEVGRGATRVLAHLTAQMTKPPPERPFEGIITIHSEISPMAGVEYEVGRPSEEEITLTRMLDKVLRRSDAVDKESLCIVAGKRVWHLRLTIHILSDEGNLLDCACLAGIVAMRHWRRPEVEVVGEDVIVHDPTERAPLPLALHHTPLCFTFALYSFSDPHPNATKSPQSQANEGEEGNQLVVILDPTKIEERMAHGLVSVALNVQREICVLNKLGGTPLDPTELMSIVRIACERVKEMDGLVTKVLEKDWEGRKRVVEVV